MKGSITTFILLWLSTAVQAVTCMASEAEVAYSFQREDSGGVAQVRVDTETGRIVDQQILLDSPDCQSPKKLRRAANRRLLVLTNEVDDGKNVFLIYNSPKPGHRAMQVSGLPDEVRVAHDLALVTCDDDSISLINLREGTIAKRWRADKRLSPPGNGPQDILVLPDRKHAVISFQKDSKKGKKFGSRLAILSLPDLQLKADLRLPRNRPELHIDGNLKEQGPGPELLYASNSTNTLMTTLDLYGALALMDLSSALRGDLEHLDYVTTSLEGSWGNAFPDRVMCIGDYALVCNAGIEGGAVLVHLGRRKIVWQGRTPPGLEPPVYLKSLRKAYSVCSGKTKRRIEADTEKSYHPRRAVYEFDFSSPEAARRSEVKELTLNDYAIRLIQVATDSLLLLLAVGENAQPDTLATFDPIAGRILYRYKAAGVVAQFEGD